MKLERVTLTLCTACINGVGRECHTPECALYLHAVDLPIHRELLQPAPDLTQVAAALEPFAELGTDHTDLPCHRDLVPAEKCGRCSRALAARAALALLRGAS